MRQTNTKLLAEPKPLGVIDVVSAGLDLVRKRPWTMLIPLLIELALWFLPRLSLTQLLRPYAQEILNTAAVAADPGSAEEARASLMQFFDSFNLVGFVVAALNTVTRFPSLLAVDSADVKSPITSLAYTIQFESPALLVLLFIPLFLLGLFAVAIYLELIAQGVRPLQTETTQSVVVRIARMWLRLILFSLLTLGLVLAAIFLLSILAAVTGSAELAVFFTLLLTVGLFWLLIYFFFVPSALAVSGVGVREALRRSMLLFRMYFWATVALVALTVFLDRGLSLVWTSLTPSPIGVVVAILANAYIGTSLIAASMVYYQDRMNALERLRNKIKPIKQK